MARRVSLDDEVRLNYIHDLRIARGQVLEKAEDFVAIARVVEDLGAYLGVPGGMGKARCKIQKALGLGKDGQALYEQVRTGRNLAVHEGAIARATATAAIALAMKLEKKLMAGMNPEHADNVRTWMNRDVVVAQGWQTIAQARKTMLSRGVSVLPIWAPRLKGDAFGIPEIDDGSYYPVRDTMLIDLLRNGAKTHDRLKDVVPGLVESPEAEPMREAKLDAKISDLLEKLKNLETWTVLVTSRKGDPDRNLARAVLGILTPHDVLAFERKTPERPKPR